MRILLTLMFLWPAASLADFTRYYPDTKPFLQEDLRLPYLPLVDDLVTGCAGQMLTKLEKRFGDPWLIWA